VDNNYKQNILLLVNSHTDLEKLLKLASVMCSESNMTYKIIACDDLFPENIENKFDCLSSSLDCVFLTKSKQINNIIEEYDASIILAYMPSRFGLFNNNCYVFNILRIAKIPSLIIGNSTIVETNYEYTLLHLSFQKETKEQFPWLGFLTRKLDTKALIYSSKIYNNSTKNKINAIKMFGKKIMDADAAKYEMYDTNMSFSKLNKFLFSSAQDTPKTIVFYLSFAFKSLFGEFFETRRITRMVSKFRFPIFYINPKKDYYIPCK
jgi:hypothetical protein